MTYGAFSFSGSVTIANFSKYAENKGFLQIFKTLKTSYKRFLTLPHKVKKN